jgi:hypothetical protein
MPGCVVGRNTDPHDGFSALHPGQVDHWPLCEVSLFQGFGLDQLDLCDG